ncbi:flagellin [Halobacillus dabanensis]|uniref:Flagellin n=1 Tax=Halobacillus dabanensis TaxID=240302 RepID=A0A1I3RIL0_HALDA|nr:flagellin [Halobacillus dabanensis]SFJ45569.1 flagellin [Halobacillus dabanensis]
MRINHNIAALNTHRQLGQANQANQNSMEKLSSGLRINNASDDAAGLAISEKMRGQIRGLEQAQTNAQDGISMIQTAEGALNETHDILQRMRELATQASNDTNTETDRGEIQKEVNQLTSEINRIGNTTEFNTQNLLNGGGETTSVDVTQDTASVASTAGQYSFDLSGVNDGDAITIDGTEYTAGATGDFAVGADDAETASNLASAIGGNYSASVSGTTITLTEDTPSGSDLTSGDLTMSTDSDSSATIGGFNVDASSDTGTAGVYSFDTGDTIEVGNVVTVGDVSLTEGTDFDLGADDAETASNIATALGNEGTYSATVTSGSNIQITETTASGDEAPSVSVATPGAGEGFEARFQVGANEGQSMSIEVNDMRANALGLTGTAGTGNFTESNTVTDGTDNTNVEAALDVSTHEKASEAITKINDAIEQVSAQRSDLGAYQNRLDHTINNLGTSSENLTAAESRIRDVDYDLAAA